MCAVGVPSLTPLVLRLTADPRHLECRAQPARSAAAAVSLAARPWLHQAAEHPPLMYRKRYTHNMTPGALIADLRAQCGLTQAGLARRSGVSRTAINAYERGTRVPTATTLLRLVEACDMVLTPTVRPTLDLERNAEALEQVLDLAELLPSRPQKHLKFPALASV